ncbi:hypothetical protein [uncultured Sphingomonas sp.]|uniref:hypothetical protein n=1 Tax=uncultured Sphingomonas sp. TaxID=158754 RepID=UPI00263346BA|nr:hypothetical protein [uncultured Sphingomonas sp.]
MIEALLVVLTKAVEGRDSDFNDWYTNVHTRDALRCRGSIAQQRFRFAREQVQDFPDGFRAQYLALYEVFDAARFAQEHVDNAGTPRMEVEDSIDTSRIDDFHYYPLQFRDKAPRSFQTGSVVLEQFQARPGQAAALRDWYNDVYLPERFRQDGIVTASLLGFDPHGQLMPYPPAHDHVGIWRLGDDGARELWRRSTALGDCPFIERASVAVTCWDVLTPRVTEDDVFHTTAAALAAEERARQRIHTHSRLLTARTARD